MNSRFYGALLTVALFALSLMGRAQEVLQADSIVASHPQPGFCGGISPVRTDNSVASPVPLLPSGMSTDVAEASSSSLLLPVAAANMAAYLPVANYGGYVGVWGLHEGFNLCLGMSVSASFGKHRFPGVGFGTTLSAMYVRSLTDRFVVGVGGFYDRLSWDFLNEQRFGIDLLAGYRLTDCVSLYGYASKTFWPRHSNPGRIPQMPWLGNYGGRVGGLVHFKVSDAVSFSVGMEGSF